MLQKEKAGALFFSNNLSSPILWLFLQNTSLWREAPLRVKQRQNYWRIVLKGTVPYFTMTQCHILSISVKIVSRNKMVIMGSHLNTVTSIEKRRLDFSCQKTSLILLMIRLFLIRLNDRCGL